MDFFAMETFPYMVAAGVLAGLVVLEILGLLISGISSVQAIDHALGLDNHVGHEGQWMFPMLQWINAGRVPTMAVLMGFLASFSVMGFAVLGLLDLIGWSTPDPWITAPVALIPALWSTRAITHVLARVLPQDETYVLHHHALVGKIARVTVGPVRAGVVARGEVLDQYQNLHFPTLAPFDPNDQMPVNAQVLIVGEREGVLLVMPTENSATSV